MLHGFISMCYWCLGSCRCKWFSTEMFFQYSPLQTTCFTLNQLASINVHQAFYVFVRPCVTFTHRTRSFNDYYAYTSNQTQSNQTKRGSWKLSRRNLEQEDLAVLRLSYKGCKQVTSINQRDGRDQTTRKTLKKQRQAKHNTVLKPKMLIFHRWSTMLLIC